MKERIKYITVILSNMILLVGLSAIWIDGLELSVNRNIQQSEILKIGGFSVFCLVGISLLVVLLRKKGIQSEKKKIRVSALVTLLICSYIYIDYSIKIVNNQILYSELRNGLLGKVIIDHEGIKVSDISYQEYQQFYELKGFHKLSSEAHNIEFNYSYPSFTGDYSFVVTYYLPLSFKIEEIGFKDGDFKRTQRVVKLDNYLMITFEEIQS